MRYVNGKGRELYLSKSPAAYISNTGAGETQTGSARNEAFNGSGGDLLIGGGGDDTYFLWDNLSTIRERAGEGIDTMDVRYWGAATLADNVENLILSSPGATSGTGNALDNILIAGSVGATLDGKAGDDVLVGGAGADVFKISAGNGSDAILNFKPGSDAIALSGYGVGTYEQLLKVAQQVSSDVVLKFANGETLAIRDVQLSSLTAYDFGMKPNVAPEAGTTVLVGAGACNTLYGWYVLNNVWNPGSLKSGTDFTIDSSYHRADLTEGTTFNWSFPLVTEAFPTIRAYPSVIFGPSPHSGGAKASDVGGVFPIQVDALEKLVATYDVSIQGNAGGFNVAYDIWFTSKPNGDASTITTELMVWLHKGDFSAFGQVVGTYVDGDISAKIYFNQNSTGNYIAVVLDNDRLKGEIDLTKLIGKLQDMRLMSASEYLASIELGSEVVSGGGSLKINNLDFSVVERGNDGSKIVWQVEGSGTTKTLVPGNNGNDVFLYEPSKALLDGGAGSDTLLITDERSIDLSNATSQVAGTTKVLNFEHVDASQASAPVSILGSAAANTLLGGSGDDFINGKAGSDLIDGGAGRDHLYGGDGDDRMVYDRNDHIIDGGAGRDTLVLKQGAVVDLGRFGGSQVDGGAYVTGFEAVDASDASSGVTVTASPFGNSITGSAFADRLTGGAGCDTIKGGAGDDIIDGGAGSDNLYGGDGNDRIVYDRNDYVVDGGAGNDTLVFKDGATIDLGRFSTSQIIGGAYVTGFENVDASGASAALKATGSQYNNTIIGSAFNDTLAGGGGYDILTGGAGRDTFVFDSTAKGAGFATITDFSAQDDTLAIDGKLLGLSSGALGANAFHNGTSATTPDQKLIYNGATGELFFDADGSGSQSNMIHIATLNGNPALNSGNFQIF